MGRHSNVWQEAVRRTRAPSWTNQRLGWKLLALSLLIATVAIWLGTGPHTYWFRAEPEPRRTPITSPPPEGTTSPEPGVSLTVGPEQSPSATPTPVARPPAPAEPAPAPPPSVPPRADRNIPNRVGACAVALRRVSQWEEAFNAHVTVTNRASTPVNGWTVGWRFRGAAQIRQVWNGRLAREGATVAVRDDGWNATIPAGGSVTFGFEADPLGRGDHPEHFTLNGVPCADAGRGADRDRHH